MVPDASGTLVTGMDKPPQAALVPTHLASSRVPAADPVSESVAGSRVTPGPIEPPITSTAESPATATTAAPENLGSVAAAPPADIADTAGTPDALPVTTSAAAETVDPSSPASSPADVTPDWAGVLRGIPVEHWIAGSVLLVGIVYLCAGGSRSCEPIAAQWVATFPGQEPPCLWAPAAAPTEGNRSWFWPFWTATSLAIITVGVVAVLRAEWAGERALWQPGLLAAGTGHALLLIGVVGLAGRRSQWGVPPLWGAAGQSPARVRANPPKPAAAAPRTAPVSLSAHVPLLKLQLSALSAQLDQLAQ
jgi:hypothetical protein